MARVNYDHNKEERIDSGSYNLSEHIPLLTVADITEVEGCEMELND